MGQCSAHTETRLGVGREAGSEGLSHSHTERSAQRPLVTGEAKRCFAGVKAVQTPHRETYSLHVAWRGVARMAWLQVSNSQILPLGTLLCNVLVNMVGMHKSRLEVLAIC